MQSSLGTHSGNLEGSGVDRRTAERFMLPHATQIETNGVRARLVDLSDTGAQVVSPHVLRPNEEVGLILDGGVEKLRLAGVIAWSTLELKDGRPRYRAGVRFHAPTSEAFDALRTARSA